MHDQQRIDLSHVTTAIESLSVDDIRARLNQISAEEAALRTLLRAGIARERKQPTPRTTSGAAS